MVIYRGPKGQVNNLTVRGDLTAAVGRSVSLMVAASDAPDVAKNQADYVCDGTDDHVEIQAALDELAAAPSGGILQFSKGTFAGAAKLTYNGPSLWLRGSTSQATSFDWTGDFFELGAAGGNLATFDMSDMEITEVSASTTAVGVQSLSALTKGSRIKRIRASAFGGGEFIFNGATAFDFVENYISHNRASSTGSGLKIVANAGASWGVTTIRLRSNYFASTVSGADPLVYIEDVATGLFESNIYENLPAGTVGLQIEPNAQSCRDLVFVNEHYEAFTDPPWQLVDCTNVVTAGCRGAVPTFTWSAVAVADRYAIVMGKSGSSGTGDITHVRHLLAGLTGVNDINNLAGVQIGPVDGGGAAVGLMSKEGDAIGEAGVWKIYANDTGGIRRHVGSWGHFVSSAHASLPSTRFIVQAVTVAGGVIGTVFEAGALGVQLGAGGDYFEKVLVGSVVWDPPSLADGETATTTVTIPGATQNSSTVSVGMNQISSAGWQLSGIVTAADTVTITLTNHTGGTVDLGAGAVTATVIQV